MTIVASVFAFLLQISVGTTETTVAEEATKGSISLIELLLKGGFVMIPLLLLSLGALYIIFERIFVIQKAVKNPAPFMEKVKKSVLAGNIKEAQLLCEKENTPVARMISKGIERIGAELRTIEASIENVGKIEIYYLEKNLSTLATISGAAPMIGFLGTVTGMIQAFIAIAQEEGTISPKLLSSGIYEAMITTAAGLAIGIVAYIGYNYLIAQVQKAIHKMEYTSIEFIELLQEPR